VHSHGTGQAGAGECSIKRVEILSDVQKELDVETVTEVVEAMIRRPRPRRTATAAGLGLGLGLGFQD